MLDADVAAHHMQKDRVWIVLLEAKTKAIWSECAKGEYREYPLEEIWSIYSSTYALQMCANI